MRPIFLQALWMTIFVAAIFASTMLTASAQAATFVYVSNSDSNDIYIFQLNRKTGELTPVDKVAIPNVTKAGMSTPMTVSPDRRFLYIATRGEPQMVATYAIDAKTGKLKYLGNAPLVDSMAYISTDRTGRYLFAASYPGHKITVSPINAQGIVEPTQQILLNYTNAHSILADSSNRFVIASTLGNDLVNQFKFDAKTGKLEPNTPPSISVKAKTGPRHFAFHPNKKLFYLLGELDASVHVFDYDVNNGTLQEKQAVSGLPAGVRGRIAAADLHVTPNGKFLYMTERTSSTLAAFRIASDGTLTFIEHIPTETQPRAFNIDSSNQYLYVVGQKSHQMSSYKIDAQTGKLTKLKEYAMGKTPNWVEIIDLR